jgi:hypothetical protein
MFILRALMGLAVLASRLACLIVIAWFIVFAVDQSKAAAKHQVGELEGTTQRAQAQPRAKQSATTKKLDEVAKVLVSPFASLTSGGSAWRVHIVDTLLVLLIYGVAFGFLARIVRLRI